MLQDNSETTRQPLFALTGSSSTPGLFPGVVLGFPHCHGFLKSRVKHAREEKATNDEKFDE